jgi:hypothetical protein
MKQHLLDHFVGAASHHATQAKCCKVIGAKFSEMQELSKAAEGENGSNLSEACESLAKEFQKMSDSHCEQGEACAKFAELLSTKKTLEDEDLSKLKPTAVSAIAPPRAVTRTGQPSLAKTEGTGLVFSKVFGED